MMKPEPSERLSGRGPRSCGPWPGGCRGMKRRKNSSTSSSSIPGTCGTAAERRTACVVLMLTTALPCSSTSRVKSGSCACTASDNAASHSAATAFIVFIPVSWFRAAGIARHWRSAARSRRAPRQPRSPCDWRLHACRYGSRRGSQARWPAAHRARRAAR